MSEKILLIDVPNLFYRAFYAIPRTLTNAEGLPINAVFGSASTILSLIESEKPDYIFAFKDEREKTFRHHQDETYKAQRPDMPSELVDQLVKINELFEAFSFSIISMIGYEADDCIATAVKKFKNNDTEILILSGDQDLFGLIDDTVFVLKPEKGGRLEKMDSKKVKDKVGVYPKQIADYKAIAGDPSDNITGVVGIGSKGAAEILNQYDNLENLIENAQNIPGRKGKLLLENLAQLVETKKMTELHSGVPIDINLSQGRIDKIDWDKVGNFFQQQGFRMLLSRISKMSTNSNQKTDDLFDLSPKNAQEDNSKAEQLELF